jgi:hypothetical protein
MRESSVLRSEVSRLASNAVKRLLTNGAAFTLAFSTTAAVAAVAYEWTGECTHGTYYGLGVIPDEPITSCAEPFHGSFTLGESRGDGSYWVDAATLYMGSHGAYTTVIWPSASINPPVFYMFGDSWRFGPYDTNSAWLSVSSSDWYMIGEIISPNVDPNARPSLGFGYAEIYGVTTSWRRIPEPGTALLLAAGLVGVIRAKSRRAMV